MAENIFSAAKIIVNINTVKNFKLLSGNNFMPSENLNKTPVFLTGKNVIFLDSEIRRNQSLPGKFKTVEFSKSLTGLTKDLSNFNLVFTGFTGNIALQIPADYYFSQSTGSDIRQQLKGNGFRKAL